MDEVERSYGIPASVVRGISRNRNGALGRSIVGYLGRKLAGYPLSSISEYFRRDSVSLCQGISKMEKRMRRRSSEKNL